jgi:8-oxo-dGTP pyrophosphatase MutT (NUDIX family)
MPQIRSELVEVYIFRRQHRKREYLLLQRAANETLYPNLWQIVTGTLNKGEKALAGALRELKEETQLPYSKVWNIPIVNSFYNERNDCVELAPLFAVEIPDGNEPVLSQEHQLFQWLEYEEASRLLAWPNQRWALKVVDEFIGTQEIASQISELKTIQRKEK